MMLMESIADTRKGSAAPMRTIRLGQYFYDGPTRVTVNRARRLYPCHCGDGLHVIRPGDLYMHTTDLTHYPKRTYACWHSEHLRGMGRVIVVDKNGGEVACYGGEPGTVRQRPTV